MRILLFALSMTVTPFAGAAPPEQLVIAPAYDSIKNVDKYATRAEYQAALLDKRFQLTRANYNSDGLAVSAYVYAPVKPKIGMPVIVFNRGSYVWKEFGGEYLTTWHRLGEAGFVVVAPMLRGSGGAEGRDELGGADLDDVMNSVGLLRELSYIDLDKVFLYGESRGGMMTYQAIRDHYPARAAAVYGGFTDMAELTAPGGRFEKAVAGIWPDYALNHQTIDSRRSALTWPERLDLPLLIMHGGSDHEVPPSQSLRLAGKLQSLGKPYELVIRAGSDHVLSQWRVQRDALAIEWFRRHM